MARIHTRRGKLKTFEVDRDCFAAAFVGGMQGDCLTCPTITHTFPDALACMQWQQQQWCVLTLGTAQHSYTPPCSQSNDAQRYTAHRTLHGAARRLSAGCVVEVRGENAACIRKYGAMLQNRMSSLVGSAR